jgi:hypothetical protein
MDTSSDLPLLEEAESLAREEPEKAAKIYFDLGERTERERVCV